MAHFEHVIASEADGEDERSCRQAVWRGWRGRCPNCGSGRIMDGYLKTRRSCQVCREDFYHHRADDGPAYMTILIVGHLMGVLLHVSYVAIRPEPLTLALSMAAFATLSALLLLPRVKGMIIAYQWAKGMHGF